MCRSVSAPAVAIHEHTVRRPSHEARSVPAELPRQGDRARSSTNSPPSPNSSDFDSVWTLDRIVVPEASDRAELQYSFGMMEEFPKALPVSSRGEWFQGWPLIPWLAAKTSKVRIGMSITDTPYRAPGVLAAEIATVDHLSNGRINVGVGSGWMPEEFAAASASTSSPSVTSTSARRSRSCRGSGPTTCSSTTASSPTSTNAGSARSPCRPAPADLLQRAEGSEALGQPDRQVRPGRLDRDPGLARGAAAVARRDRARAGRARRARDRSTISRSAA